MMLPTATEDQIHAAILAWFRLKPGVVVFHVPNGGLRAKTAAVKMKRLGALAGAPDLVVLYEMAGEAKTLLIEVKAAKGRQSPGQKEFERACVAIGHDYLVARSLDDVMQWWGGE